MSENKADLPVKERWRTVDELRGFAILLLFAFNGFYSFSATPTWLRHAPVGQYYIFDLVAPLFLFAVGLSYLLSYEKRSKRDGKTSAIIHVFKRGLILILFGTAGDWLVNRNFGFHWGTLEMIGLSGILALPFMTLKPMKRIFMALWLIAIWQMALGIPGISWILGIHRTMGGPAATVSWMSVILIASALSEWKKTLRDSEYFSALLMTILILHLLYVFAGSQNITDKLTVNSTYMLYSLQLSATAFFFFYLKELYGFGTISLLESLGKNALALYMISGVTNKLALMAFGPDISITYLAVIASCQILLSIGIGMQLDRKKIYFAL